MRVPALCRDRAAVVIVGDVGLQLDRTPFYERELSLRFARSYGPGRYDPSYEAWGVDYPAGQVRWSEGRNFEAVLDLLAAGRLAVGDLVTHTFDIGRGRRGVPADRGAGRAVPGHQARLPGRRRPGAARSGSGRPPLPAGQQRADRATGPARLGLVGAGAFATGTLLPALRARGLRPHGRGGLGQRPDGDPGGAAARLREGAWPAPTRSLADPDVSVVVIATPHDTHAALTVRALRSGPPRVVREAGGADRGRARRGARRVAAIRPRARRRLQPPLVSGRGRGAAGARAGVRDRRLVVYRIAAGPVPERHWYHDRRQGGRLLGEVCHFVDTAQALVGAPDRGRDRAVGRRPGRARPTTRWSRCASRTARWPASATAAPSRRRARNGSRSTRARTGSSSTTSGRSPRTAGSLWKGRQDKGHRALAAAFRRRAGETDAAHRGHARHHAGHASHRGGGPRGGRPERPCHCV